MVTARVWDALTPAKVTGLAEFARFVARGRPVRGGHVLPVGGRPRTDLCSTAQPADA